MKKTLTVLLTIVFFFIGLSFIRVTPTHTTFGFYAGMCSGNCGTMYEVTNKTIRVDTTSFWQLQGETEKLKIIGQRHLEEDDEGDFDSYKIKIPLIMLLDPRTRIGCPDCSDQGGIFLDFEVLGIRRQFKIDRWDEPIYFKVSDDINDKIKGINDELEKYGTQQSL